MIKKLYRFFSSKHQTVFLDYPVDFKPRYGNGLPAHDGLNKIIAAQKNNYKSLIDDVLTCKENIQEIKPNGEESDSKAPVWNNDFLPGLDIVMLYGIVATKKPSKYIEVGSGNSTKVAFKAKKDYQLDTEIVSIDPMPRAEIDDLSDKIIRKPFEETSLEIIEELEAGDILFIDNSHRILPNSDAMVFFMEVLPKLKKGVIVQIHDIYLPFDYPQFMCDRAYNEQYGLAFYLLANPDKFEVLAPNFYMSKDQELATQLAPFWESTNTKNVEKHGGSFWLRVN